MNSVDTVNKNLGTTWKLTGNCRIVNELVGSREVFTVHMVVRTVGNSGYCSDDMISSGIKCN